ncbi:hypothetical protein IJ596_06010, partial [bacterium]|nr:hypothetical protein [bacterium]
YNLLVHGKAEHEVKTFEEAYNSLHTFSIEKGKFLEKDMPPVKLADFEPIKNGDSVIFTNYRNDRTRQLTDALTQPKCEAHFLKGQERLKDLNFVCMTEYNPDFNLPVAFPVKVEDNTLPDILDKLGCETFFTTERDKQAHLTFFLRGKKEGLLSQSGYNLIPSSKGKLTERMKGGKIKDAIISWITRDDDSRACIANFPNPDIIGHEAIYDKAANTLQILDKRAIKPIVEAARDNEVATIITADHGNIEDLTHGGHTNNPVPFIAILPGLEEEISKGIVYLDDAKDAAISRVAPSFLDILGIKPPAEMYDSLFKMKS